MINSDTPERRARRWPLRVLVVVIVVAAALLTPAIIWFLRWDAYLCNQVRLHDDLVQRGANVWEEPVGPTKLIQWWHGYYGCGQITAIEFPVRVPRVASADPKTEILSRLREMPALETVHYIRQNPLRPGSTDFGLSPISNADLRHLSGLRALRDLGLEGADIDDEGLREISKQKNLTALNLSMTEISDAGLVELEGLVKLKFLNLNYTSITDEGISSVVKIKSLRAVGIRKTDVTRRGIDILQTEIPGIEIDGMDVDR